MTASTPTGASSADSLGIMCADIVGCAVAVSAGHCCAQGLPCILSVPGLYKHPSFPVSGSESRPSFPGPAVASRAGEPRLSPGTVEPTGAPSGCFLLDFLIQGVSCPALPRPSSLGSGGQRQAAASSRAPVG